MNTSSSLTPDYNAYYGDPRLAEWRRFGARQKAANIRRLAYGLSPAAVLDVGSGDGAVLQALEEQGFAAPCTALEISATGLEALRARQLHLLTAALPFDGESMPFADQEFDLAILSHVLEHVEYPRKLLAEIRRVAKRLIVEVPLEDNAFLPRNYRPDPVGHINFYNPKTFRRLLQTCGFVVEEQITKNPERVMYTFMSGVRGNLTWAIKESALRLVPPLATRLWTYHGVIRARAAE